MSTHHPNEDLLRRAHDKVKLAEQLKTQLGEYKETPGCSRIERKIQQEIRFLEKLMGNNTLKENNLISSNLIHYEFLIKTLRLQQGVVHIDSVFPLESRELPLRVDIVANNGLKWVKVIARNSKSVRDAALGLANFGSRSILDQAQDYLEASQLHSCMFQQPKIYFYFSNAIDETLRTELANLGVTTATLDGPNQDEDPFAHILNELNLDVTTLLAYVSAVSNGRANWLFREPLLTEQAEKERESPLKPQLDKLFEGKSLVCCELAHKAFQNILMALAGPSELQRAAEFMRRVKVLPDVVMVPKEFASLRFTSKVNERSLKIFAFGFERKIFTVTSNKAFVRSAKMQGINVPVHVHPSRALTERKELTAKPL